MCQEIDKPHCFIVKAQTVKFDGLCSTKIKQKNIFLSSKSHIQVQDASKSTYLCKYVTPFGSKNPASHSQCGKMKDLLSHRNISWKQVQITKFLALNELISRNFWKLKHESLFVNFPHCDIWMPNVAKIGLEWH